MALKDDSGRWLDSAGNAIPQSYVKAIDKKRDALVERMIRLVEIEEKRLKELKEKISTEVDKYLRYSLSSAGVKENPGGNYTFTNFSGNKQVEIKICKFLEFDERLQFAKSLIDDCLERWSEGDLRGSNSGGQSREQGGKSGNRQDEGKHAPIHIETNPKGEAVREVGG